MSRRWQATCDDNLFIDHKCGRAHDAIRGNARIVLNFLNAGVDAECQRGFAGDAFKRLAVVASGSEHLDEHFKSIPLGEDRVEEVTDDENAAPDDGDEYGQQLRFEHTSQQDEFGE